MRSGTKAPLSADQYRLDICNSTTGGARGRADAVFRFFCVSVFPCFHVSVSLFPRFCFGVSVLLCFCVAVLLCCYIAFITIAITYSVAVLCCAVLSCYYVVVITGE